MVTEQTTKLNDVVDNITSRKKISKKDIHKNFLLTETDCMSFFGPRKPEMELE